MGNDDAKVKATWKAVSGAVLQPKGDIGVTSAIGGDRPSEIALHEELP